MARKQPWYITIFTKKIITNTVVNYVCILCDLGILGLLIYDILIK